MEGTKSTKTYVIDASAVLSLLLPDEKHKGVSHIILKLLDKPNRLFIAPHLLKYEVANGLRTAVIRKRIGKEVFDKVIKEFNNLPIKFRDVNTEKVCEAAFEYSLTPYDASYLHLSKKESAGLIALDKDLQRFSVIKNEPPTTVSSD